MAAASDAAIKEQPLADAAATEGSRSPDAQANEEEQAAAGPQMAIVAQPVASVAPARPSGLVEVVDRALNQISEAARQWLDQQVKALNATWCQPAKPYFIDAGELAIADGEIGPATVYEKAPVEEERPADVDLDKDAREQLEAGILEAAAEEEAEASRNAPSAPPAALLEESNDFVPAPMASSSSGSGGSFPGGAVSIPVQTVTSGQAQSIPLNTQPVAPAPSTCQAPPPPTSSIGGAMPGPPTGTIGVATPAVPTGTITLPFPPAPQQLYPIGEIPPERGISSFHFDDLDEATRAQALRAMEEARSPPDPRKGFQLLHLEPALVQEAPAPGGLGRSYCGILTGGSNGVHLHTHVLMTELFPFRPVGLPKQLQLHRSLRMLGPRLRAASPLLLLPWGVLPGAATPMQPIGAPQAQVATSLWLLSDGKLMPEGLATLQQFLAQGPSLAQRLHVAYGIAEAVMALHDNDMCHGSLASRSVYVAPSATGPKVRISDAGLLSALQRAGISSVGEHLALGVGRARYLAPEGWFGNFEPTAGADIWALGLLVAECLGGGIPHAECGTLDRLSNKVLPLRTRCAVVPRQPSINNGLPKLPEVASILNDCMEPNPHQRPTALAMLSTLGAAVQCEAMEAAFETPQDAHPAMDGATAVLPLPREDTQPLEEVGGDKDSPKGVPETRPDREVTRDEPEPEAEEGCGDQADATTGAVTPTAMSPPKVGRLASCEEPASEVSPSKDKESHHYSREDSINTPSLAKV